MRKRDFKAPTPHQLKMLREYKTQYLSMGPGGEAEQLAEACHAAEAEVRFLRKEWKRCVVLDPDERY
jgi:hypothetical protein